MAKNKTAINIGIGATVNDSLGKSFEQAKTESRALGREYTKVNKQLSKVQEVNKYRRQLDTLNKRMKSGRGDTLAMQKVHARLTKEMTKSRNAARRAGANMSNLVLEERRLKEQSDRTRRAQAALNTQIKKTANTKIAAEAATPRPGMLRRGGGLAVAGLGKAGLAIGATLAPALAAGAMVNTTLGVMDRLDATAKRARRMGMDVEAAQELDYAADRSGIEYSTMHTAFKNQADRISQAAMGGGTALDALEALKLDIEALNKMAPEKQIEKIADALVKVKNENDRITLARKVWGNNGDVMLNMTEGGATGIQELRKDARNNVAIFSKEQANEAEEFNDQLLNIQRSMGGVRDTLAYSTMPAVLEGMEGLNHWLQENSDSIEAIVATIMDFVGILEELLGMVLKVIGAVATLYQNLKSYLGEKTAEKREKVIEKAKKDGWGYGSHRMGGTEPKQNSNSYGGYGSYLRGSTYNDHKSVTININDAKEPEATARAVEKRMRVTVPAMTDMADF